MGRCVREPSILHLDLDAFFAAVEQRDKPSLRGKPVVVGGVGQRGVVATASYEARVFGVRSAMPAHEARRRCPHAAFLTGRFGAYRDGQRPGHGHPERAVARWWSRCRSTRPSWISRRPTGRSSSPGRTAAWSAALKAEVGDGDRRPSRLRRRGSSKFIAKVATELAKPDGLYVVEPGHRGGAAEPMPVSDIPGVGPVTPEKLHRIGVRTVADLHRVERHELGQILGRTHADALVELAYARDDRPVEPEREAKSISVEDTFEVDLVDRTALLKIIERDARQVSARLGRPGCSPAR